MIRLKTSEPKATLASLFQKQAAESPLSVALRDRGESITYADLDGRARHLAAILQSNGLATGQLVAIRACRSADYVVSMLATVLAGGAYLPLDPCLPFERLRVMVEDAKPALILDGDGSASALGVVTATRVLSLKDYGDGRTGLAASFKEVAGTPEHLAYVMYTSGSTGTPKGVCIAQRGILRLVHKARYATFGPSMRVLQNSPLSFDASTFEIWGSLLNGGTCVLMPYPKPSLQDMEEVLVGEQVTTLFLTTALFVELAERRPSAFRAVKEVLTGGEPIPPNAVKRVLDLHSDLHVIACYGPTECTTFASTHRYTSAAEVGETIGLGEAIEETELYVLREDRSPAAILEEGELYISGSGVAQGYLNQPDLTGQVFTENPFSTGCEQKLYRTGDRCVRDESGALLFKGRVDRQIKLRGFRIELGEIEATLVQHPTVQAACIKAEKTLSGDKALMAYVVPKPTAIAPDPDRDEANFAARTEEWEKVYSKLLYKSLASTNLAGNDDTFNTSGWKSSFDGRHISNEEMEEQVGQTVERILALRPRKILEIGCGTGMLLFRLAPHCDSYIATDFSQAALDYVQPKMAGWPCEEHVTLLQRAAHEIPEPPDGEGFDVVVINSVTEHFASLSYLDKLIHKLVPVVREGGYIFVGDNRNFQLLPHFHAAVQLAKSASTISVPAFALRADQATTEEQQLTIDPYYFAQVDRSQFSKVSLQLRRGTHHNELTGYRYDATLQVGASTPRTGPRKEPLQARSLAEAREAVNCFHPETLVLWNCVNARLHGASLLLEAVGGGKAYGSVGELRRTLEASPRGEDPEDFWALGAELGYDVQVIPSAGSAQGNFDAVFRRQAAGLLDVTEVNGSIAARSLHQLANDPLLAWRKDQVAAELRAYLEQQVPEHAVPSFFVVLPRLPLSANGKVDVTALPWPARLATADSVSGTTEGSPLERQIREVWERVLGIRNIALTERFFEIGGDSLKAVRVGEELSRILHADVSPALLFEQPTIAGLAKRLSVQGRIGAATALATSSAGPTRGQSRRTSANVRQLAQTV